VSRREGAAGLCLGFREGLADGFRGTINSGTVYTWSGRQYVDVKELHTCTGYWIYVEEARVIPVEGLPVGRTQLDLAKGWNKLGVETVCALPDEVHIIDMPWIWDPLLLRYRSTQTLRPGLAPESTSARLHGCHSEPSWRLPFPCEGSAVSGTFVLEYPQMQRF